MIVALLLVLIAQQFAVIHLLSWIRSDLAQPIQMPQPVGCAHLETENLGTFGAPDVRCKYCGAAVDA